MKSVHTRLRSVVTRLCALCVVVMPTAVIAPQAYAQSIGVLLTGTISDVSGETMEGVVVSVRSEGANLRVLPRLAAPRAQKAGHRYAQPRPYYGLEIASDHIVFVLDKSESMYYGLFDGVVEEVEAHLSAAGPTTKFNVVEFDEQPRLWQKRLAAANPANVRKAVGYLQRAKPIGPKSRSSPTPCSPTTRRQENNSTARGDSPC